MSGMSVAEKLGTFILTSHAKERMRQRLGITGESAALSWVKQTVANAKGSRVNGNLTHYYTDMFEVIISKGEKVVTVTPTEGNNSYLGTFKTVVAKEAKRLRTKYERELRKAEIDVAEINLNFLRARNPKTKAIIEQKLTEAIDYKALVEDELRSIEYASKRFGVEERGGAD